MAATPLDFTFKKVDAKDTTWFDRRELGHPDDPYNKNCKKISKDDPQYAEWVKIAGDLTDQLEKDILQDEGDGWVLLGDSDGVVSHKKENEGSNILTFKGCTIIPSTAEIIRLFLIQMDQRKYWDPTFVEGNFEYEAESTLVWSQMCTPHPGLSATATSCALHPRPSGKVVSSLLESTPLNTRSFLTKTDTCEVPSIPVDL